MKLGEVAEIRIGLVLSRKEAKTESGVKKKYQALTVKSLGDNGIVNTDELFVFGSTVELEEHYLTQKDDVIVRLTYPYTAVHIDDALQGFVVSSLFAIIKLKTDLFIPEYIALLLNNNKTRNSITRLHSGSSAPSIKKSFLEGVEIKEVPLDMQMKLLDYSRLHRKEKELLLDLLNQKEVHYQAVISKTIMKEG